MQTINIEILSTNDVTNEDAEPRADSDPTKSESLPPSNAQNPESAEMVDVERELVRESAKSAE